MGKEFILNESIKSIKDKVIYDRYKEVIICFNSGCYNAVIVSLYTTMIYDMVLKLDKLAKIYNNTMAEELLNDIKSKTQQERPDSNWELDIIEKFYSDFRIISVTEKNELLEFRRQRHYSAHPVLFEDERDDFIIIKNVTKETALDCIRKVYDYVLNRDAIIGTSRILQKIVEDANDFILRNDMKDFNDYITSKYFNLLTDSIIYKLFSFVVKLVFSDVTQEGINNRTQNVLFLQFIYDNYKNIIINNEDFKNISNKVKIENVLNCTNENIYNVLRLYSRLFCFEGELFECLGETNRHYFLSKLNSMYITDCYKEKKYRYVKDINYPNYYFQLKLDLYYLSFKKVFSNEDFDLIDIFKSIATNSCFSNEDYTDGTNFILGIERLDIINLFELYSNSSKVLYDRFKDFLLDELSSLSCFANVNLYAINYLGFLEPYLTKNDYIKFKKNISNNSQYTGSFEFNNITKYLDNRINSIDIKGS